MSKTILYIEDDLSNRLLVRHLLGNAGYRVVEAVDGLNGVQAAQAERPDLILMDLGIPGLDGYETTTRIKSLAGLGHIPIIALTATAREGDRQRALTAGCDGYLTKPINVDRLPQQIAEFLNGFRETVAADEEKAYLREYNPRLVDRLEQKIKELSRANQALVHTDLMKSRFINLAAHELRTPLTALHGYIGMLATQLAAETDENTQQIFEGVNSSVDRLRGIVQDMLDITRIEAGKLQLRHSPVSLALIFNKIRRDFENVAQKRQQRLAIAEVEHMPMMWGDGERITQILRNLVSNAIKYTPDGGEIALNAEIFNEPATPGAEPRQLVRITLRDTGIGIAPDQQERIFESFYEVRDIELHSSSKTDFMGGGAGLGLPIARGVAEAHGGSLWVESNGHDPERCPGSTFYLILPLGTPATG
ncbi:MAG: hybrid sensor histidine kinase/response regulator [Chloroflexota bacterium]